MESIIKKYTILIGFFVFVCTPLILYSFEETLSKTLLKMSLSVLTLLAFVLLFSQFFISQINHNIKYGNKINKVLKFHKYLGYFIILILFFHPLYIVIPRYFEGGISPIDGFLTMLDNFTNQGMLLGIIAWILMCILGITSYLRFKLKIEYKNWKLLHDVLAVLFITLGTWHVMTVGRHEYMMNIFFILLVGVSITKLLNNYFFNALKQYRNENES